MRVVVILTAIAGLVIALALGELSAGIVGDLVYSFWVIIGGMPLTFVLWRKVNDNRAVIFLFAAIGVQIW